MYADSAFNWLPATFAAAVDDVDKAKAKKEMPVGVVSLTVDDDQSCRCFEWHRSVVALTFFVFFLY